MSSDVIVMGGGIAGLATAWELLRSGATVTVLERNLCGQEASWAGAGILSPLLPWDYPQAVTRLTQFSTHLFPRFVDALQAETGVDPEYQASGMLVLPDSSSQAYVEPGTFDKCSRMLLAKRWCARHAIPVQEVQSRQIAPSLMRDTAALWLPEVCQVRNPRLLQALIKAVKALGGKVVEHAEVAGWKIERGHVQSISTVAGERRSAGQYVVAAGAWSRRLLAEHAAALEAWPVRGQILLFKAQPGLLEPMVFDERDNFYLIPRRDGHILAGSTLEEAGFDKSTTPEARETLLARAQALVPVLAEEMIVAHWAGLRPASPHNIPVISMHPAISNLYLNSGHYRYGVTMAPGSAQLIANMILGKLQSLDVTSYQWPI
ncbi:glycine oxidase [Nitrosospira multiformis]|uniref:Glycine oxidase n=1 Tax=Nitrosospira multiformis TaxID=1231 RepID=A0A1H8LWA1_9PROT|nr:glycine oxidase ThiO [Nitrosospira multiformis]SEO09361.1 glycine oxidase [Nitrosospira multiformis]